MCAGDATAQKGGFYLTLVRGFLITLSLLLATLQLPGHYELSAHPAGVPGPQSTKYAIIVGINEYENEEVTPLRYAINDAHAI